MKQYSNHFLALAVVFLFACGQETADLTRTSLDGPAIVAQYQDNHPTATQSEATRGAVTLARARSGMLVASLVSPEGTRRSYFVEGGADCTDCTAEIARAQGLHGRVYGLWCRRLRRLRSGSANRKRPRHETRLRRRPGI